MKHLQNAPSRILSASKPDRFLIEPLVHVALLEDLAHGGDVTTDAIVPAELQATARIVARRNGVIAGLDAALLAFELLQPGSTTIAVLVDDGGAVAPGTAVAQLEGPARVLLTGERTMLNLLCRLSGIASATRKLVDAVAGTRAQVIDTRKTTPGLRILEKYAVRCGGGGNHRFGLDDAVLIKDNHLALAGSIHEAVARVRERNGHMLKVEVEVDTLEQLREALREPIDAVLLDNMEPATLQEAVRIVNGTVLTEASGGVRPETIAAIAQSGVDLISVGWLTHSAPALDLGLDIAL
ncbi:MAG TPA: carboxylating nicotinate-nucleotide diphosphorylase [Candidatus Acidoferrum sp.]|nr:carboxylating nicotinate-nucleotide diphosphorylase [Candidatus Acidoferrum sp.]